MQGLKCGGRPGPCCRLPRPTARPAPIYACYSCCTAMRRMAQLLASRVSALSAAATRPSAMVLGRPAAPAPVLAQRASLRTLAPFLGAPVRPQAPGLLQIRAITEEASPVLADVLREEVKYEQENYKQPEARSAALVQYQQTSRTT